MTAALVGVLIFGVILLLRNQMVYGYRTQLLDQLYSAADADIETGREWRWRRDAFNATTYSQMMLKFWKPLDSFYPDKSFLEPTRKGATE